MLPGAATAPPPRACPILKLKHERSDKPTCLVNRVAYLQCAFYSSYCPRCYLNLLSESRLRVSSR